MSRVILSKGDIMFKGLYYVLYIRDIKSKGDIVFKGLGILGICK